jgi:hypothetical protein
MNKNSLHLITELWDNRDKSITEFHMYNDIFIDNCVIGALYKLLVELQKTRSSLDLEYMIYIINKNHLSLEGFSDNGREDYSFINFPLLNKMLNEGIALKYKLAVDLQLSPGYWELCKIVEK